MDEAALRNFKDFLLIYNQMAELCFTRCVSNLGERSLTSQEEDCVDKCANKHVNINHKMMSIYMEVQPLIINKRNEELQKQIQQQQQQQQQQQIHVTEDTGKEIVMKTSEEIVP